MRSLWSGEDVRRGLGARGVAAGFLGQRHALAFVSRREAFRRRVGLRTARAAHARGHPRSRQECRLFGAGAWDAAQYKYGPFGEFIRAAAPLESENPFGFSTKFQDDETVLLDYRHRDYDPGTGRWPNTDRDPLGERGSRCCVNVATPGGSQPPTPAPV